MQTLDLEDAALALNVSSRSLADRRWRLRVVLVGHRAREDLYVGVASRRNAMGGSLGNCHELRALFVDIDFKAIPEAEARGRLDRFLLKPSFVIASGGGLHCYWLLHEPFDLPGEAQKAKSYLRRLALHLGGGLNSAVERMLGVAERVWRFNGRFDFLQRLHVTEARWHCQS